MSDTSRTMRPDDDAATRRTTRTSGRQDARAAPYSATRRHTTAPPTTCDATTSRPSDGATQRLRDRPHTMGPPDAAAARRGPTAEPSTRRSFPEVPAGAHTTLTNERRATPYPDVPDDADALAPDYGAHPASPTPASRRLTAERPAHQQTPAHERHTARFGAPAPADARHPERHASGPAVLYPGAGQAPG